MQQDMENKIQSLLAEMERVQKQVGGSEPSEKENLMTQSSNPRLQQLEEQVNKLTDQRLQHLETLQTQQMEMQVGRTKLRGVLCNLPLHT